jgi:hypothetical protein
LSREEVLFNIAEAVFSVKEGINQVLFALGGKFTREEIETLKMFKEVIFESGVTDYVTIVRTKFEDYDDKEKCEKDRDELIRENEGIADLINACAGGIIYVNNPSVNVSNRVRKHFNEEDRKNSRKTVLDHLMNNCQRNYRPSALERIYFRINAYLTKLNLEDERQFENLWNLEEPRRAEIAVRIEHEVRREIPLPSTTSS